MVRLSTGTMYIDHRFRSRIPFLKYLVFGFGTHENLGKAFHGCPDLTSSNIDVALAITWRWLAIFDRTRIP